MEFCPKCGAILIQKEKNSKCPRCNYSSKEKIKLTTSETIEEKQAIGVVSPKDTKTMPVVSEVCKGCKNNRAYFWTVQMRAADEAETKFFKCTKCNFTWKTNR
ncbi:MAG: transcription factor S [archaeon]